MVLVIISSHQQAFFYKLLNTDRVRIRCSLVVDAIYDKFNLFFFQALLHFIAMFNILKSIFNPPDSAINFQSFLKFSELIFKFFFFNFQPIEETAAFKKKAIHAAKLLYFRFVIVTFSMSVAMFAAYGLTNMDNFLLASSSVPNSNCILLIFLKGLVTFTHREDIWNICQELKQLVDQRIMTSDNKHNLKEFLDDYHRVMKIYSIPFIVVSLPIVFPLIPFLINGEMDLLIRYWYPVDIYQANIFPFAWLWVNWIAWNASVMLLAVDALLFALIAVIAMEFVILRKNISTLSCSPEHERTEKIRTLTDTHNRLLDFVEKLQRIYGLTFLFCFVISSLIICFIAFQMSVAPTIKEGFMFNVPYISMMVAQVFLLCFGGQKLINSSLSVAEGVYDCGWHEMTDNKMKKMLLIIMVRSQRPAMLTAMNFAEISFPSFTTVTFISFHLKY